MMGVVMDFARLLLEATHDAGYLCDCRRDGAGRVTDFVVREVNAQGLADFGFGRDALVGKGMRELFQTVDLLPFFRACVEAATSGETHEGAYTTTAPNPTTNSTSPQVWAKCASAV